MPRDAPNWPISHMMIFFKRSIQHRCYSAQSSLTEHDHKEILQTETIFSDSLLRVARSDSLLFLLNKAIPKIIQRKPSQMISIFAKNLLVLTVY